MEITPNFSGNRAGITVDLDFQDIGMIYELVSEMSYSTETEEEGKTSWIGFKCSDETMEWAVKAYRQIKNAMIAYWKDKEDENED